MVNGFQKDRFSPEDEDSQFASGGPAIYPLREIPFVGALERDRMDVPGDWPHGFMPISVGEDWGVSRQGRYNLRSAQSYRASQSALSPFIIDRLLGEGLALGERLGEGIEPSGELTTDEAVFTWGILEDESALIIACATERESVTVPAEIDGRPVTAFGSHSFSLCYDLAEVHLPEGIVEIGEYAFMNTALRSFKAPSTLRRIGTKAFYRCSNLEQVELNEGLYSVGVSAFEHSSLKGIELPGTIQFLGIDALKSTDIVFTGEAPTVVMREGACPYRVIDGSLYWESDSELVLIQALDSSMSVYRGPAGLTSVNRNAFFRMLSLEEVWLPEGLVYIGPGAFKGCSNLTRIELPSTLLSIEKEAILETRVAALRLPASLEYLGLAALCTVSAVSRDIAPSLKKIELDPANEHFYLQGGVLYERDSEYGDKALLYVGPDIDVVIPDHVTSIGPYAFANIRGVHSLEIHDKISVIDAGGLFLAGIPPMLRIRTDQSPEGYLDIRFPHGGAGLSAFRTAFSNGRVDIPSVFANADRATLSLSDAGERSRTMIARLMKPYYLRESVEHIFRDRIERSIVQTCLGFSHAGYLQGFVELEALGMLKTSNIDLCIATLSEAGEVAGVNELLDIRRRVFNLPVFDFDL